MHDLFRGHFILALEDIFKLKGVCPVEVNLLGPLVEIRDCFADSAFGAESTPVNVDLRFQFIETRVLVLHLVHLLWEVFLVERLLEKSQRWFLVDRCHFGFSRQLSVRKRKWSFFCFPEEGDVCYPLLSKV